MATPAVAQLFDAMADDYDTLEPWYGHYYPVLHALLRSALAPSNGAPPGRVLDAGCGTGFQAALLESMGYVTHGLDLSSRLLAAAARRLRAPALARGNVESLPYRDEAFDAVTCCGSTLSFVERPATAVAEIARVLRPGGRLFLDCEHKWSVDALWTLASALAGDPLGYGLTAVEAWRALARRGGCVVPYPGYGALRLFTLAELRAMLRHAGLEPVRTWGIHATTPLIPSTVLHRRRLPGPVATLFRGLCALDDAVRRLPGSARVASSVVLLARRV
ncbi:MAG TPA: methyltransferase domain-containing protein [Methylomirabilota bacterium]|nr:methyltransferase domain-containing protein [Methylomirabilota bacterium]